ncbi:MAG TPA: MFS transporter [Microscillaceae bacterium]|nr:MFS transporter [Microscillaceae bacterium]
MQDSENPNYARPAYAWYVVAILTIAYVSSFIDRQIVALLADDIRKDLQISEVQVSLLMGFSFAIFYTLLGLPIGRLSDYKNRRNIIAWGIFVWSLMTAACGLAKNYWQFFLARVGVGIGEAALSPAAYSMITDYFPKRKLATALSIYSMGLYLGGGLALLIGGFAAQMASYKRVWEFPVIGEVFSWQLIFFLVGLPGLLVVLLTFTIREPLRQVMKDAQGNPMQKAIPLTMVWAYIKQNLGIFFFHNFGFAFFTICTYGLSFWLPTYIIRNYGISKAEVGITLGIIQSLFATSGIVVGGRLADYLATKGYANSRQIVMLMSSVSLLICCIPLPFLPSITWVWIMAPLVNFTSSFGLGTGTAVMQEVVPPPMRGLSSAIFLFLVNFFGLGFGPTIVASITQMVYADDKMIGYSLLTTAFIVLIPASLFFWASMRYYRISTKAAEAWRG